MFMLKLSCYITIVTKKHLYLSKKVNRYTNKWKRGIIVYDLCEYNRSMFTNRQPDRIEYCNNFNFGDTTSHKGWFGPQCDAVHLLDHI